MIKKVINVAEMAGKSWNFIERFYPEKTAQFPDDISWKYYSGSAMNIIERVISRPKISRYRACFQASNAIASERDVVISHLPRTSHWQSVFMHMRGKKNPHMAFAFNFTDLPTGRMHYAMKKSFCRIDQFVVYSQFERERYAEYFNIPIEKIQMLHWAMEKPVIDEGFLPCEGSYYCAVGGEGRDYKTLISAFKDLPQHKLVIVTRPNTLDGVEIPLNVQIFYNLPSKKFWGLVDKSKAVIVPLVSKETACGHITLVGAMKLGKAIVTTYSYGTTDYIIDNENGLVVQAQQASELVAAVQKLESSPALIQTFGQNNRAFAKKYCEPSVWASYIQGFIESVK